jgi:ABC-type dipeptide/oligopeptide/nickel transport system permease subunit
MIKNNMKKHFLIWFWRMMLFPQLVIYILLIPFYIILDGIFEVLDEIRDIPKVFILEWRNIKIYYND